MLIGVVAFGPTNLSKISLARDSIRVWSVKFSKFATKNLNTANIFRTSFKEKRQVFVGILLVEVLPESQH